LRGGNSRLPLSSQGGFDARVAAEKLLHVGDGESGPNAITYTDQGEAAAIFVVRNICPDEGADAGGVHVGNGGKIENQMGDGVGTNAGLKIEKIRNHERAGESKNETSSGGVGAFSKSEGLVRHKRK